MIQFKQKEYVLPLVGALASKTGIALSTAATVGGAGISAYQGHNANVANEEAAEQAAKEQKRHNKEMEKAAQANPILANSVEEQKSFAFLPANFIKGAEKFATAATKHGKELGTAVGNTQIGGFAKDLMGGGVGKGLISAGKFGAGMAGVTYAGNKVASAMKNHDEGQDGKTLSGLAKVGTAAAAIGGGIWAAKSGKLGGMAKNFMDTGAGGKALSSVKSAVNPIVRDEANKISVKGSLGKVGMNGVFAAMPVASYMISRGQKDDQVNNQLQQQQYSDDNNRSGFGKKLLAGAATLGTIAGAAYGAHRGVFGAGMQKHIGNLTASTGSLLRSHGASGIGDKMIKTGSNAVGNARKTEVMNNMLNKGVNQKFAEKTAERSMNKAINDRVAEANKGVNIGQNITGGISHIGAKLGFVGKGGTEAVQNTANRLASSNNEISKSLGTFMQNHKNTANLMAGGASLAAGGAALGVGESLVKKPLHALDKDAYKIEEQDNQRVYSTKSITKKGISFNPKTGSTVKFQAKKTVKRNPGEIGVSETLITQKEYTQWDQTDQLKNMTDSNILAEQKRDTSRLNGKTLGTAGIGATLGAAAGGILGGLRGGVGGIKKGMMAGATLGGLTGGAVGISQQSQQRKENQFFNDRLEYAQNKALKREKADWKNNMNNREGYTQ